MIVVYVKVRFGQIFSRDAVPAAVKVNNEPPFSHTDYDGKKTTVVVCHKVCRTFQI